MDDFSKVFMDEDFYKTMRDQAVARYRETESQQDDNIAMAAVKVMDALAALRNALEDVS